jgi:quercetin dioxygenase-like cupin family protein
MYDGRNINQGGFMVRLILALAWLALPTVGLAQQPEALPGAEPAEHAIVTSDAVTYGPIEIPGFDSGIQIAVVHGDPNAESGDYTLRLKFPDGYRFPAHYHPMAEHVTVMSGSMLLAMGDSGDLAATQSYTPGAFLYIPGGHPHYGGVEGETVVQLHGVNPFKIVLAEKAE